MLLGCAMLRTKGPRTIPRMIWRTTSGTGRYLRVHSAKIGARTAAIPISTSVGIAASIICVQFAVRPHAVARPATSPTHATRKDTEGGVCTGRGARHRVDDLREARKHGDANWDGGRTCVWIQSLTRARGTPDGLREPFV